MTEALYLHDAQRRSCEATVEAVSDDGVVLDRTILYAESGGQAPDHGWLRWGPEHGHAARVVDSQWRGDGDIVHALEGPLPEEGQRVEVELDWDRRYGLMRHHTAVHVLAAVVADQWGALFTGGQLYPDRARLDCAFEAWSPEMLAAIGDGVNEVLARDLPVRHDTISRDAYEAGDYSRLRDIGVPEGIEDVRLTIIGDPGDPFDVQADGGTHVARTGEVGRVVMDKAKNKGRGHRRLELHCERA